MTRFHETFNVGERYRATFTLMTDAAGAAVGLHCEWDPAMPNALSETELADYFRGRDEALEKLANASGIRVALVEPQ